MEFYKGVHDELSSGGLLSFMHKTPHFEWKPPPRIRSAVELINGMINRSLQKVELGVLVKNSKLPDTSVDAHIKSSHSNVIYEAVGQKAPHPISKSVWTTKKVPIMQRCDSFISNDVPKILNEWLTKLAYLGIFEPTALNASFILSGEEALMANYGLFREKIMETFKKRMENVLNRSVERVEWKVQTQTNECTTYYYHPEDTTSKVKMYIQEEWERLSTRSVRDKSNFDDYEWFIEIFKPLSTELAVETGKVSWVVLIEF